MELFAYKLILAENSYQWKNKKSLKMPIYKQISYFNNKIVRIRRQANYFDLF
jgi:hypothetical protein